MTIGNKLLISVFTLSLFTSSQECRRPALHFLFLVYDRVHNGDLWAHFFSGAANAADYHIHIQHSKPEFRLESWPLSAKSEIAHYASGVFRYARYVYASDNLLVRALNRSVDPCDQFLLLSGDAIPIVNFDTMFSRFIDYDRINGSSLCITDTAQWIRRMNTNDYFVKHHNWWALNKENATYAHHVFAAMIARGEREEDLFGKETDGFMSKGASESLYATEEFWYYKALYGNFDISDQPRDHPFHKNRANRMNLKYPCEQTQGYCSTFVYWGASGANDAFNQASIYFGLQSHYMDGIHMTRLPLSTVEAFYDKRKTNNFVLVRKITKKTKVFMDNDLNNMSRCNVMSISAAVLSGRLLV